MTDNSDITAWRTKNRGYIQPKSDRGKLWVEEHMIIKKEDKFPISVGVDYIDELINTIEADGLGVDKRW